MSATTLNKKIFEELFTRYFAPLTGFVYSYVRNEEAAKDIVHDTFLTFGTTANVSTCRIPRNLIFINWPRIMR